MIGGLHLNGAATCYRSITGWIDLFTMATDDLNRRYPDRVDDNSRAAVLKPKAEGERIRRDVLDHLHGNLTSASPNMIELGRAVRSYGLWVEGFMKTLLGPS